MSRNSSPSNLRTTTFPIPQITIYQYLYYMFRHRLSSLTMTTSLVVPLSPAHKSLLLGPITKIVIIVIIVIIVTHNKAIYKHNGEEKHPHATTCLRWDNDIARAKRGGPHNLLKEEEGPQHRHTQSDDTLSAHTLVRSTTMPSRWGCCWMIKVNAPPPMLINTKQR